MTTVRDAARAAVPFGMATVDLHRILVRFALDGSSPEYKAPLNAVSHARTLADPGDRTVVNLNVDTPYSYAWLDLRTGPVLLTMPAHEPERYMSAQVVDLYTNIVGYVSPRTMGDGGGTFLVRGHSTTPTDLEFDGVLECPTDLGLVLVRTQLFDDADLPRVTRAAGALLGILGNADGSVTIHVRHERPASGLVANWLPAPAAPFGLAFRTYPPREPIHYGAWTAPAVRRTT